MSRQAESRTSVGAHVRHVRRAVNVTRWWRALCWAALVVGAVAAAAAAGFAVAGVGVPWWLYAAGGAVLLLAAGVAWTVQLISAPVAARMMDEHFELEDGVRSAYAFESRGDLDAFETLQVGWTLRRLGGVGNQRIASRPGSRLIGGAVGVLTVAALIGLTPESQAVVQARRERAETVALAEQLNQGIREMVEEEIDESDDLEKDALDPEALREMVEKLEASPEQAELLRQYAEMEQQLARKANDLKSPELEQLLDEAAAQLSTAPETAKLGDAMRERRLSDAAEHLDEFMVSESISQERLAEKRAEIEKLGMLAKRLAEASRKVEAAKRVNPADSRSPNDAASGSNAPSGNGKRGSARESGTSAQRAGSNDRTGAMESDGTSEADESDLDEGEQLAREISELEEALEDLEESLRQCESGQCTSSDRDRLARSSSRANKSVGRISQQMRKGAARSKAQSSMRSMQQALSQCQSAVAGLTSSPFAGGREAGWGSSDREHEGSERSDGLAAELTAGAKSWGPAMTSVEEADAGDGVSYRRGATAQRDFARQLEAFVGRPDVPQSVKEGVKLYLENIHRTPEGDAERSEGD